MNSDLFHILMIAVMSTVDSQPGQDLVRMCQYNSATRTRTTNARFNINQIDFTLCTHYVFAYANVDVVGKTIRAAEPADEGVTGQYRSFTSNKFVYLQIKMLLSVGGPSPDNHAAFNAIVREESNIQTFAENAVQFVRQQRFDGLEIDWQSANDSGRLVTLLKTLKNAFIQESSVSGRIPLLLTVKCPGLITYAEEGFASKLISWYVDYVLLATYDLVVPGTAYASFSSPLYGMRGVQPDISVNSTVRFYEQVGIPFKKMLLGIRAAGRYSKLSSTLEDTPGSRITKQVVRGSMYNLPSTLAYPEVCQMRKYGQVTFDDHQKVPYLVYSDYWVGYEDRDSIRYKMRWLGSLGIVGIMFPALDEDDFSGTICGEGKHPLLSYIKTESELNPTTKTIMSTETTAEPPPVAYPPVGPGQTSPMANTLLQSSVSQMSQIPMQSTATTDSSVTTTRTLTTFENTDDVFTNVYLIGMVILLGLCALIVPIVLCLLSHSTDNSVV